MSNRHVPRFVSIESKEFRIKVDDLSYGGSILITEKVKEQFFHVSMELGCVEWLIKELQILLENKLQSFFRRYRGDSYQVWAEKGHNWKGCYLRLTKCVHGRVKSVVIPQGKDDRGWIQIKDNLEGILTGEKRKSTQGITEKDGNTDVRVRAKVLGKTYKEAVQNERTAQELEKRKGNLEDMANWSWVVVCERKILHQAWDDIRKAMEDRLDKKVDLFPYQINRAFFSCDSKSEAMNISSIGKLEVEGQPDVLIYSWEQGLKNNNPKIVSYGGWIGITGLPMHWWNKEFFQHIGMECGGLLQVDQRTEKYKYLFEARIKTRKNLIGFLPEILNLTEGTETYQVKIRPISPAIRPPKPQQVQPTTLVNRTDQVVDGGEILTSQRHWRVVDGKQKFRSFSEPGLSSGLEKNKVSEPQSKSGGTTTNLKPKTKFLSRFGRENGEGSRGFRRGLSHIDDRLSSAGASLQVCSLPPSSIADREDDDSISSICPDSVDSMAKVPSSESEFVDEISSNEEMKNTDAFANEEGILHGIFISPDEPCGDNGLAEGDFPTNIQSNEQMGLEVADVNATIVPETSPEVLYYSRKRRKQRGHGRKDGLPKSLLHRMDISLMPLKKNLAYRGLGKSTTSNDNSRPKDIGKGQKKKGDYTYH